jgi:hypothetical protein
MRINDRIAEGLAALDEAEPLATDAALETELSRLHHLRGNLLFPLGRDADCLREHELARQHARKAGSLEAEARRSAGSATPSTSRGACVGASGSSSNAWRSPASTASAASRWRTCPMVGWSGLHLARSAPRRRRPRGDRSGATGVAAAGRADGACPGRLADGVLRDRREEAEEQAELALRLVRPWARSASRPAARDQRHDRPAPRRNGSGRSSWRTPGLAVCREHGMGTSGRGCTACARCAETDREARLRFLDEGERVLALGSVSHNHIQLRELAIDALLEIGRLWMEF